MPVSLVINSMKYSIALAFAIITTSGFAQEKVYVSGFVNDLNTLQSLSSVNISHSGKVVAATDSNGFFTMSASPGDTLAFTRLGYQPYLYVAQQDNWDERIFMTEMARVLDEVVIRDSYKIHSEDEMQKSLKEDARRDASPLKNFTMDPQNDNRMVQTFGPSATLNAPWDKWTKDARERKELNEVLDEQERTQVYQQFIHSMVVQQYFMNLFNLDEDTFLKKKENFIVANPDARYLKSRQDIIDLMVAHMATKKK
jgi:hypothetical protein